MESQVTHVYLVWLRYGQCDEEDSLERIFRDPHDAVKYVVQQVTADVENGCRTLDPKDIAMTDDEVTNIVLHCYFPFHSVHGSWYMVERIEVD